jgi:quinol monooxygenase YgiN
MAPASSLPPVAFVLQIKITIDPKNSESFLSHFKNVYDIVLAEPECAYFIVGQNVQEPGVFRWTEGWTKDPQWFISVRALFLFEWREYNKLMLD